MTDAALHDLAVAHGIAPAYRGLDGRSHPVGNDTCRALLAALGVQARTDAEIREAQEDLRQRAARRILRPDPVLQSGRAAALPVNRPCDWALEDEDGNRVAAGTATDRIDLPPLDTGVFRLSVSAGDAVQDVFLPVTPGKAPTLPDLTGQDRLWGVTAALYGLRSARNLGVGDYADLAGLAEAVSHHGAGFLGINPVHAWGWANDAVISPYSPSHRGFLNTLHIAADRIPGLEGDTEAAALAARAAASVNRQARGIAYDAVRARLKPLLRTLHALFQATAPDAARAKLAAYAQDGGETLQRFATFEALSTQHGHDWRRWPAPLRSPSQVPASATDPAERAFHIWLQWIAAEQVRQASQAGGMPLGLYLDLAVGARRDGAEAWMGQGVIARGVSLGAPPDHLSPGGQNWQLTAYAASRDAATGYRHFRHVLRQTMRHAGVLRIDHVLGLNRSYWIPDDGSPGGYVRQPFETLLALVEIEAHRAGCIVVGEDLGLVPSGFRETLAAHGILGYSVLQYERDEDGAFRDPGDLRRQSLACFATHDTPTLKGYCTGRDIDWWQKLSWVDEPAAEKLRSERRRDVRSLLPEGADPAATIHRSLATSPAAMIAVQLDDILDEEEAQNLPGTIDEHPNWRRPCKVPVEALATLPQLSALSDIMRAAGRTPQCPQGDP